MGDSVKWFKKGCDIVTLFNGQSLPDEMIRRITTQETIRTFTSADTKADILEFLKSARTNHAH